jgi:hypothetical protein
MRLRIFLSGVLTALCSVLGASGILALGWLSARTLPPTPAVPELPSGAAVALAEPDAGLPAEPSGCSGEWSCWETVRTDRAVQCACGEGGAP